MLIYTSSSCFLLLPTFIIPTFNAVVVPPVAMVPNVVAVAALIPIVVAAPAAAVPTIPPAVTVPVAIVAPIVSFLLAYYLLSYPIIFQHYNLALLNKIQAV